MTLTMTLDRLRNAVDNVALFAATPAEMLPILEAVRLQWDGNALAVTATDRYTLAEQTVETADDAEPFIVHVNAKAFAAALKAAGKSPAVTLDIGNQYVTVDWPGGKATAPVTDGEFPRVEKLWPTKHTATEVIALNPRLLARFAKVKALDWRSSTEPTMRIDINDQSERKPYLVTFPDLPTFRALIVSVRLPQENR